MSDVVLIIFSAGALSITLGSQFNLASFTIFVLLAASLALFFFMWRSEDKLSSLSQSIVNAILENRDDNTRDIVETKRRFSGRFVILDMFCRNKDRMTGEKFDL